MDWSFANSLSDHEKNKLWVENWKRIGPELEKLKRDELRALTDEEGTARAVRVMDSRPRHAGESKAVRLSSGLVEQQRIFATSRRQT